MYSIKIQKGIETVLDTLLVLKLLLWYKGVTSMTSIWNHSGFGFFFFFSWSRFSSKQNKDHMKWVFENHGSVLGRENLMSPQKCWAKMLGNNWKRRLESQSLFSHFFFSFRLNCFLLTTVSSHNSQHIFQSNWKPEDSLKHSKLLNSLKWYISHLFFLWSPWYIVYFVLWLTL